MHLWCYIKSLFQSHKTLAAKDWQPQFVSLPQFISRKAIWLWINSIGVNTAKPYWVLGRQVVVSSCYCSATSTWPSLLHQINPNQADCEVLVNYSDFMQMKNETLLTSAKSQFWDPIKEKAINEKKSWNVREGINVDFAWQDMAKIIEELIDVLH